MQINCSDGTLRGNLIAAAALADMDRKPNAAALYRAASVRIDNLEIALNIIVGHGNITVERAKQVAREALGVEGKNNF